MFLLRNLNRPARRSAERGFTLVELMVGSTLGLLLILAVTQVYINGTATQRAQSDVARLQESARFAFFTLSHGIRKAGYKNPGSTGVGDFCQGKAPPPRMIAVNDAAALDPTTSNLSGNSVPILNSSDVLRLRYFGESDNSILDCLGNPVALNTLGEDTYFVAANPIDNNEPTLFCHTNNAPLNAPYDAAFNPNNAPNPAPIVPGIESLQVLYGEDANQTDFLDKIDRYVPAGGTVVMNNVRGLMLSVVARSPNPVAIDRSARTFNHFGTGYAPGAVAPTGDSGSVFAAAADGRIRQQSSTAVALRNLCP